jgi:histidinol-phosphate aminotransferase
MAVRQHFIDSNTGSERRKMIRPKEHITSLFRTGAPKRSRKEYLRLDMNESASGLPLDLVKKTMAKVTSGQLAMYPEYDGLVRAVARHDGIKPENICLSNGSDGAIKQIFDAYVSPGDRVVLTDPTFAMYPVYVKMFRAKPVIVGYGDSFDFPFDAFMKALVPGVRLAVLVDPNNPMGSVIPPAQMQKIIRKAAKANILLVIDEAYHYFYPVTAIKQITRFNNLIVLRTFSKLCGMANLRLGYAAASADIISVLKKVQPTFDVNGVAILMAEKLFASPGVMSRAIKSVMRGKSYLCRKLAAAGIKYREGHANFVLIECSGRVDEVIKKLEKKGILVHGGFRQEILKRFIRVTVADTKTMQLFWKAFCGVLQGRIS